MQKKAALHLIIIALAATLCFALLGLFVVCVDPYGMFRKSGEYDRPIADLGVELEMVSYSYLPKALQIIREKPDRILLGTSIVDHAFRLPGSTTFTYDPYPEKQARLRHKMATTDAWYNAGVCGGDPVSIYKYLVHAYANNPNLKEVVISFHIQTLLRRSTRGYVTVDDALLGKTSVPYRTVARYVLNGLSIRDAFRLYISRHSRLDKMVQKIENASPTLLLGRMMPAYASGTSDSLNFTPVEPFPMDGVTLQGFADPVSVKKFTFTAWQSASQISYFDKHQDDPLDEVSFEYLRKIAEFSKDKHFKLYVILSPHHPFLWAINRSFGLEPYYEQAERKLAEILPYWDMSASIDYSAEADRFFDTDTFHFNEAAGELILPWVTTDTLAQHARYVTPYTVESVIQWHHALLDQWEAQHPETADIVHSIDYHSLKFGGTPTANLAYLTPAYKGYAILDFYGNYYAFPASAQKPYVWRKILKKEYSPVFTAASLKELMPQLDARPLTPASSSPDR